MTGDELRNIAYQRPFKPFRVHLRSGEAFNIERSLRTTVWHDRVFFGVEEDPQTGVAKRLKIVALDDITFVEPA